MTDQAVAERTDASTQGGTSEDTQAEELGTALNEENTQQSATDEGSENTESSEEDEGARLEREAREAEIERRAEEKAQSILAESKVKAVEETRQQAAKARTGEINLVTGGFGNVIKDMRSELVKAGVVDSDEQDAILAPLEGHNGKLKPLVQKFYDNARASIKDELNDALGDLVPNRQEWDKATEGEVEIAEGLRIFVEMSALSSEAVKKAKPEDLIEANKALKAKVTADLAKEELRVRKGIAAGTIKPWPDAEPRGATSLAVEAMTYEGYLKLSEADKRKFNRENPGKFAAFLGIGKGK